MVYKLSPREEELQAMRLANMARKNAVLPNPFAPPSVIEKPAKKAGANAASKPAPAKRRSTKKRRSRGSGKKS